MKLVLLLHYTDIKRCYKNIFSNRKGVHTEILGEQEGNYIAGCIQDCEGVFVILSVCYKDMPTTMFTYTIGKCNECFLMM